MSIAVNRKLILAAGCLCIFFPGSFVFGFPGVMAAHWQAVFEVSRADVGRIMFFILVGTGSSMYLAGRLQELFPTRLIVLAGAFLCGITMIAVAWVSSIGQVYAWAFAEGFFCGFVYLPCLGFFQRMFPENKGLVTGLLNLTFGGSSAIMSPLYTWVYVGQGYETASWMAGILALAAGTLPAVLIRQNRDPNAAADGLPAPMPVREVLKNPAFRYLWCVWALAGAAGVSLIVLSAGFGKHLGYDITRSVYILTSFNILNGIGRIISGRLADVLSKQKILMTIFLMAAGAYLVMPWLGNIYALSFLACFIGLSFGSMFTVSAPLVSEVFGIENFGRIFGLVFTAYGFVAGFMGPWLSGILLDITGGSYLVIFLMFTFFYALSSVLILQVRQETGKDRPASAS